MRYGFFAGLIMLAGCAEMPTQAELGRADYGQPIAQDECAAIAAATISNELRDPDSAQYRFSACEPWVANSIPILGFPVQYGYGVPVEVNARNAFGGYTGFTPYFVLIRDGAVIRRLRNDDGAMIPF